MKNLLNKQSLAYALFFLILILIPVFISSGFIIQSIIIVLLFAYWSSSLNIISGYAGQLSIGHSVYVGIGAYVTTILFNTYGLPPWIGMLIGGVAASILASLISYPCFKLQGSYFTLSTIAVLTVIRLIFLEEDHILGFATNGAMGIKVPWKGESFINMQFLDKRYYYYIILVMLVIVLLISRWVKQSKTGFYLAAIKTNQDAASSLGVNTSVYKLRAMIISSFMTALGGGFYAMLIQFIDPTRMLGYDLSVEIMLYAVIGGLGTLAGPLLGAFILVPINQFTRSYFGSRYAGLSGIIFGLLLMIVVYYQPNGLLTLVSNFFKGRKVKPTSEGV